MSDIKISVKDFRAIHSADIDLNGITVIAGVAKVLCQDCSIRYLIK